MEHEESDEPAVDRHTRDPGVRALTRRGFPAIGRPRLRDSLKSNLLNRVDLERIERGYYEQLIAPSRRLDDLADIPDVRLRGSHSGTWSVPLEDSPLVMRVDDVRELILKPDDDTFKKGVHWQTNSLGMRDRAYTVAKPPRTFRIALVGDSIGAGWGVDVEQRFESILERSWDARSRAASGLAVEIVNCAVPGQSPGQRWCHFSQVGWPMNPDMVIYQSTASDAGWDERRLRYLLARGIGWDSPVYRQVLERSRLERLGSPDDYKRALKPRHWEILAGVYQTMTADCRQAGTPIVWMLIPRVGRPNDGPDERGAGEGGAIRGIHTDCRRVRCLRRSGFGCSVCRTGRLPSQRDGARPASSLARSCALRPARAAAALGRRPGAAECSWSCP